MNRPLTFRSFCSGIGAPEVAWKRLGWRGLSTCEIEPQPAAVLAHHHPEAIALGDMTTCMERMDDQYADVFVAGTPCQSFSVAGLRKGMADPRGNLALVFLGLVDRRRPEWVVWENVPGVLSSNGGRDFGAFLGALAELGYGFAYRVLDAQFVRVDSHARAVPQRRERVFVVGHLGDWRRAAAVLLERESLRGDPAPGRSSGEGTAAEVAPSLRSGGPGCERVGDTRGQDPVVVGTLCPGAHPGGFNGQDAYSGALIAHTFRGEGHDASEDGTGRGVPLVFNWQSAGTKARLSPRSTHTDALTSHQTPAVAFAIQERAVSTGTSGPEGKGYQPDVAYTMEARHRPQNVGYETGVRRLLPVECERLQGFPDGYTQVPYRGKPMADGPRYKMIGNSMAVNVMSWIGQRIQMVGGAA
jgi:DNA (cytosine-5)-methyltransferase 1